MFSEEAYTKAAELLGCEVAAIKAVAKVESNGKGFTPKGNLMCLFEGHYFHKFTKGKYAKTHPKLSYPTWGAHAQALYRKDKDDEYNLRFGAAAKLDLTAAQKSCSWGAFQIMGSHFEKLDFESVGEMLTFLKENIDNHLIGFCRFILHKDNEGLHKAILQKNWKNFAFLYNGKYYYKNNYDVKMKNAYLELTK